MGKGNWAQPKLNHIANVELKHDGLIWRRKQSKHCAIGLEPDMAALGIGHVLLRDGRRFYREHVSRLSLILGARFDITENYFLVRRL